VRSKWKEEEEEEEAVFVVDAEKLRFEFLQVLRGRRTEGY
jgi:hypothetical protein